MKTKLDYDIIAKCLSPSVKERILYELSSPKKRLKAFERFAHNLDTIIKDECILYKDSSISDTIKSEIKNTVSECTVLSLEYQQGKNMSIDEAFDYLVYECFFAMIITEKWLIIKPERECGKTLFYFLRTN